MYSEPELAIHAEVEVMVKNCAVTLKTQLKWYSWKLSVSLDFNSGTRIFMRKGTVPFPRGSFVLSYLKAIFLSLILYDISVKFSKINLYYEKK